jgi:hypothetical protein
VLKNLLTIISFQLIFLAIDRRRKIIRLFKSLVASAGYKLRSLKSKPMRSLLQKITVYTGIEEEKAKAALLIIAAHIKDQFPVMRGYADTLLETEDLSLEKDGIVIEKFEVN